MGIWGKVEKVESEFTIQAIFKLKPNKVFRQ